MAKAPCIAALPVPVLACLLMPSPARAAGVSAPELLGPPLAAVTLFLALLLTLALKWRLNPTWLRALGTSLAAKLLSTALGAALAWAVSRLLSPRPEAPGPWLASLAFMAVLACVLDYGVARNMLRVHAPDAGVLRRAVLLANAVGYGFLMGVVLVPLLGRALIG